MTKLLEEILAAYARLTLVFHKPKIIGITGSVGKSSTKEAVALVLKNKFSVRASAGNLNSQIGLPLAVLGFGKPGGHQKNLQSYLEWLGILILGFFRIFQFNYPKVLVLEMGTDRPGDIANLLNIVGHLDVAVITDIGISHLEFFRSPDALKKEKLSILAGLGKNKTAVLVADNEKVLEGVNPSKYNSITYGFSEDAEISAQDFAITTKNNQFGLTFKVNYKGTRIPFFVPGALGKPTVYACLAATSVGISFGLNLVEISQALEKFATPPGRLKLLEGINSSSVIDDTYNAAPSSTILALEAQADLPAPRKIAVLGHMAELGNQTEEGHRLVAAKIVEAGIALVFLVGEKTKFIQDELEKRRFSGSVFYFADSELAANAVMDSILPGDAVLVKGSQSARMEKIVKKIMKDPAKAKKLLVRQTSQWLN
jgi:UDP-N-acetylmuramyl pentapeptide synthase